MTHHFCYNIKDESVLLSPHYKRVPNTEPNIIYELAYEMASVIFGIFRIFAPSKITNAHLPHI